MQHCAKHSSFFYTDRFEVVGHGHPYLRQLIKEIGFVIVEGKANFPLMADWATARLDCKDDCIENCQVEVDMSNFQHYLLFMAVVIVLCGAFVHLMERWGKRLKRKKF